MGFLGIVVVQAPVTDSPFQLVCKSVIFLGSGQCRMTFASFSRFFEGIIFAQVTAVCGDFGLFGGFSVSRLFWRWRITSVFFFVLCHPSESRRGPESVERPQLRELHHGAAGGDLHAQARASPTQCQQSVEEIRVQFLIYFRPFSLSCLANVG